MPQCPAEWTFSKYVWNMLNRNKLIQDLVQLGKVKNVKGNFSLFIDLL